MKLLLVFVSLISYGSCLSLFSLSYPLKVKELIAIQGSLMGKSPYIKGEQFGSSQNFPLYSFELNNFEYKHKKKRILITAGVHGNEQPPVELAHELINLFLQDKWMQENFVLTIIPTVNPEGIENNSRKTSLGDLNRSFLEGNFQKESEAVVDFLKNKKFDLSLDLHNAITKEFFLIATTPEELLLAKKAIAPVEVDQRLKSNAGKYPAWSKENQQGYYVFEPGVTVSKNIGTLKSYLSDNKISNHAYTVESPLLQSRVDQQKTLLKIIRKFMELI